jgi:uncharacterized protein YwqG
VCGGDAQTGAQFGGAPLLAPSETWPVCKSCERPMQFFLQLSPEALPLSFTPRGDGVLQLFYCSLDDGGCETWSPFSGTHLVRLLSGPAEVAPHPAGLAPLPVRWVTGWSELVDYPHAEEHRALGLAYDYDFPNKRVSVACDELGVALRDLDIDAGVAETIGDAAEGDKLGGWPLWVQGVEYPSCPTCGSRMQLVLQVDSEDNIPHMFGDAGCGHVTQCPVHSDVLAFAWACS